METMTCYICNNLTTDFCTNLYQLESQHSNTRICKYLTKFLGGFETQRDMNSDLNCACSDCLNRIDEYDWVCVMSTRFEQELTEILLNTERLHSNKAAETIKTDIDCEAQQNEGLKQRSANDYGVQSIVPEETLRGESGKKFDSDVETNDAGSNDDGNNDPDFMMNSVSGEDDSEDIECKIIRQNTETTTQESKAMSKSHRKQELPMKKRYQMLAKQSEYQFNCTKCGETFSLKTQLQDHDRWHIKQQAQFRCKICFYISKNAASCEEHAKLHKDRPELDCVFCNKEFESQMHLKRHMVYHVDENFLCHVCGKAFNNVKSYNSHMKYHSNIRSFKCSMCPRTFVISSHLIKHRQTHSKDKPFTCSICGNPFRYRHNMQAHEKTHSETDKIHQCSFCDAAFARKSKLNQHLEKQHSSQTSTSIKSSIK